MRVRVQDRFEIRPGMPGTDRPPGLVVVFTPDPGSSGPLPGVGVTLRVWPAGGEPTEARIAEVHRHGAAVSFFLPGRTAADVPIGSIIDWKDVASPVPAGR